MTGVGTTVVGWTVIAAAAGGIYYLSSKNSKPRRPAPTKQTPKPVETKKDKSKKVKKPSIQSDGDSEAKSGAEPRKNKKQVAPTPQPQQATYAAVADEKEDDVQEFARQMAAAKSGAFVAPKSKSEARAKSVKQSKAHEKPVELSSDNLTAPSSANGGDADDDQSPANSPDLSATTVESPVSGGIEDMLEKSGSGPSVLKITAPTNPTTKKPKAPASQAPVETKKQRQNRQKAEAQKLQREQDEAERQKLLEQTRRNARIAEGRAAKDGSAFLASKAPADNSWSVPPPTVNGTSTSNEKVQLLDTNEPTTKKPTASEGVSSQSQEQGSKWNMNLSEEEQIRLINENENWETVKKDKKKRAKKEDQKAGESSADESKDFGVPPKIEPSGPGKKWAATLVHVDDNKNIVEREVELQDDEWEVS